MLADVAERALWQEQITPPSPTAPTPPPTTDVVIVGAGYAGLEAARVLASAGRSVAVVEARSLGWGAHARNGGMVLAELKHGPAALERRHGELGQRMWDDAQAAFDHIETLIADHGLACDYERCGELYLAHTPRHVPELARLAGEHTARGDDAHVVAAADLHAEIGSDAFAGGVVFARAGSLHPAKYHAGLASLAADAGAAIVEQCPAIGLEPRHGGGLRVVTPSGAIDARDVVVTTNAYADALVPTLRRRVLPVGSFIVTTEPLDETVADQVSPRRRMFVDTKHFLYYWRLTPDRRLLFGGRRGLGDISLPDAAAFLTSSMRRIHPQVASVPVTHRWGGSVAITIGRLPHVGRIDRAWYATGCNGSGVALNTWLGHELARHLLGEGRLPSFAELRHRSIPLHALRRLWQPVVGEWLRWQDRR